MDRRTQTPNESWDAPDLCRWLEDHAIGIRVEKGGGCRLVKPPEMPQATFNGFAAVVLPFLRAKRDRIIQWMERGWSVKTKAQEREEVRQETIAWALAARVKVGGRIGGYCPYTVRTKWLPDNQSHIPRSWSRLTLIPRSWSRLTLDGWLTFWYPLPNHSPPPKWKPPRGWKPARDWRRPKGFVDPKPVKTPRLSWRKRLAQLDSGFPPD